MTCKTLIQKNALVFEEANSLYAELVKLPWKDAVRSRNGFTRLAHQLDLESKQGEKILGIIKDVLVLGVYINYYRDGNMYTPQHSHKGTHQLVISLGVPRTLLVGKKSIKMENGDAVLFGSSTHGVPKEVSNGGRISIATFMAPLD
jgi:hypothetical protein